MKNLQIPKRDEPIREKMREFQTAESFKNPVYWLAEDYNKCPVLIPDMIREMAFWNLVNSVPSTQKGGRRMAHDNFNRKNAEIITRV